MFLEGKRGRRGAAGAGNADAAHDDDDESSSDDDIGSVLAASMENEGFRELVRKNNKGSSKRNRAQST